MTFKASFCDPFKPDIIEYGMVESDKMMEAFDRVPWEELLAKMQTAKDSELYYSPSFEIENISNNNGLSLLYILLEKNWKKTTEDLNSKIEEIAVQE